jgi:hypothetical protein
VGERVSEAGPRRESQGAHDEDQRHARTGAPSALVVSDGSLGTDGPQDGRQGRKYRARMVTYWIATLLVAQENVAVSIWAYVRLEFITANLMAPLVYAVLTTMSWVLRPPERRLVAIIDPQPTRARDWVISVVVLFLLAAISLLTLPKGPDGW